MQNSDQIRSWALEHLTKKTPKPYFAFDETLTPDVERNMKKLCMTCRNMKYHREFTMAHKKDADKYPVGVYRNNSCRLCERNPVGGNSDSVTVGSLQIRIEDLEKELREEKESNDAIQKLLIKRQSEMDLMKVKMDSLEDKIKLLSKHFFDSTN